ncbi:MAG TPA: serine protease [Candidatus Paceibacterota bacterium]
MFSWIKIISFLVAGAIVVALGYVLVIQKNIPTEITPEQQTGAVTPDNATTTAGEQDGNITEKSISASTTTSTAAKSTSSAPATTTTKQIPPKIVIPEKAVVPILPETKLTVPTSTPESIAPKLPPEIAINPQTIVGLLCRFDLTIRDVASNALIAQGEVESKGSGVIVSADGKILTNRHVVRKESGVESTIIDGNNISGNFTYSLKQCLVGVVPPNTTLPTPEEIRTVNPLVMVTVLPYTASVERISSSAGLSDMERQYADFALLKINGLSPDGPTFGYDILPTSFPYAKVIPINETIRPGEQVITFGFPGDVPAARNDSFATMYLSGSLGTVQEIYVGDVYYINTPLLIATDMEIYHGRSGSPLFWRGYVIGLVTAYSSNGTQQNRTESLSVASDAILKNFSLP